MRPGLWVVLVVSLLVGGISPTVSAANGDAVISVGAANGDAPVFSQEWLADFSSGSIGCHTGATNGYTWRRAGFGSNINILSESWVAGVLQGDSDRAVVLGADHALGSVRCPSQSDGVASVGWSCLFRPMPHVCVFDSEEDWKYFMGLRNVSNDEQEQAAGKTTPWYARKQKAVIYKGLSMVGGSVISALAMLADHLMSHLQPWVLDDIQSLLNEPKLAAVREGKYIGAHVRRSDKLGTPQGSRIESEVYLKNASDYIRDSPRGLSVADITGLWVASDDASVIGEVQSLAQQYFPNIGPESVIWISGRTAPRSKASNEPLLPTHSDDMNYDTFVTLLAELQVLREADVFIGTFSSNIGRLMMLLREANGFPRDTTRSVHVPEWFPGRRLLL